MGVDLLRREVGNRRSSRFWDRGQWFCGFAIAVLTLGVGLWSLSAMLLGREVDSTVQSCATELHLSGRLLRHVTDCEVTTELVDRHAAVRQVEASRPHPAGTKLTLVAYRGTYADAALNSNYVWLGPVGLAVAAGTWWMGLPSRVDLTYGRHAAPRKRRRS